MGLHLWHCARPLKGRGGVSTYPVQLGPAQPQRTVRETEQFGEERGAGAVSGEGGNGCERRENVPYSQGNPEEIPCRSDDKGRDVNSP